MISISLCEAKCVMLLWFSPLSYLIGLSFTYDYYWFLTWSLLGGISISSLLACQDLTLCDVLGNQFAHRSHSLFSTIVGLGVLAFCLVHSMYLITSIIFFFNFTAIYKFFILLFWYLWRWIRQRKQEKLWNVWKVYHIYNLTITDENVCLRVVSLLQFLGGCYWILPPIWEIIRTRRLKD